MQESGWLNVNKPVGWTSTKVVAIIKRITKAKKVGHGGTLDPLASGVLPICINKATKQVESMMDHRKEYLFYLTFGELRDTADAEGVVLETNNIVPTVEQINTVLSNFVGVIKQTPPIYSAIKVDGKRACDLVREGKSVELQARDIVIYNLKCNGFVDKKTAEFIVECGRGCYVRSLGVDLAKSLGAIGYLSKIERLRVGDFDIDDAVDVDGLDLGGVLENLIVV